MYFTCHAYIKGKHKLQSKLVSLLAMTQDLVWDSKKNQPAISYICKKSFKQGFHVGMQNIIITGQYKT